MHRQYIFTLYNQRIKAFSISQLIKKTKTKKIESKKNFHDCNLKIPDDLEQY